MMEKSNKQVKQNLLWLFLAVLGLIMIFWKARYGYGGDDEAFYLTIPHRLLYGDIFIKDEWHLSQLSAFLNIPFVWIYHTAVGSMEGIILAARYYYVLTHFFCSFVIYNRLKNYGIFSAFASVIFLVFVPFNISAYSYNALCVDLLVLMGVFMATASPESKLPFILSGIFYAGSVLCCPYLVLILFFYFGAVIIDNLCYKRDNNHVLIFCKKQFVFFCLGILFLAITFLLFVIINKGFENLFENIKLILNDPEHAEKGLIFKIKTYILDIIFYTKTNTAIVIYYFILTVIIFFDKKRKNHRLLYLSINSLATVLFVLLIVFELKHECYNAILYPFALLGLVVYYFINNKPSTIFVWIYLIGFVYSFAVNMSSNTCFYVIMMAMVVSDISVCIFIGQIIKEIKTENDESIFFKPLTAVLLSFAVAFQVSIEVWSRLNICYWDENLNRISGKIEQGPAKGIITTEKNKLYYDELYNDLQYYKSKQSKNILCFTENTVSYLIADFPYGTFSAWTSGVDNNAQNRLISYYNVNKAKIPEYVYLKKSYYNTRYDLFENNDFSAFQDYLEKTGYKLVEENRTSIKYEKVDCH